MKAHSYEKAFLGAAIVVLLACMGALGFATFVHGIHLPGIAGRIDPAMVRTTPPFDQPGVKRIGDNAYRAVLIASAWSFNPPEIRVPAGAEITFTVTSTDLLHGFNIEGTRLNMMLVPGQISENRYTFREPGEYTIICHEYCGLGHHTMFGRIIVTEPDVEPPASGD